MNYGKTKAIPPKVGQAASLSSSGDPDRQAACSTFQRPRVDWLSKVGQAASLSSHTNAQAASLSSHTNAQAASLSPHANAQAAGISANEKNDRQAACSTVPASGYFNPFAAVDTHRRHLPQWRQDGVWYFVTYRLADSLPRAAIEALEAERSGWLATHPEPRSDAEMIDYWDRFGGRIHDLLDAGSGECWLQRIEVRDVVVESLRFGEGKRYRLDTWVVMPNHVHALVMPLNRIDLSKILHTWKSYTANRINQMLKRTGKLWQDESYNHIVRNPAAFFKIRQYILKNPAKAKLQQGDAKVGQAASLSPGMNA